MGKGVDATAPSWLVTYGDLMSLIMCFFILLFALSEPSQEKILEAVESVGAHFNVESTISSKQPKTNLISNKQLIFPLSEARFGLYTERGGTPIESPFGRFTRVLRVREGLKIVLGGKASFEAGSLDIGPEMAEVLAQIAPRIKDGPNRVEIRGHAAPDGSEGSDPWDISWYRARAVALELARLGVPKVKFYIEALGAYDPVGHNFSEEGGREFNRRVEIVVTKEIVPELLDVEKNR